MKFSVPVVYTVTGWIELEAKSLKAAKQQASLLSEKGVPFFDIKNSETHSHCMTEEVERLK